jgi:GNAT superfamily N-acetyltransferase
MSKETDNREILSLDIRLATASDASSLAKLRYALRSSTGIAIEDENAFVERCKQWMVHRLKEESSWRCWLAEQDQTLMGALWVQLIEKIPNPTAEPEYYAYVTNFYVRERVRGAGIGSRLLSTALTWCKAASAHAVILWPTERSRSLYERFGFAVRSDLLELLIAEMSTDVISSRHSNLR